MHGRVLRSTEVGTILLLDVRDIDHRQVAGGQLAGDGSAFVVCQNETRAGILENMGQSLRGISRIKRNIGNPHLGRGKYRDDRIRAGTEEQRHTRRFLRGRIQNRAGEPVCPRVQL